MMKRVVAAFVLFLTAVSFALWSGYAFINEMNSFEDSLTRLVDIAEKSDDEMVMRETEMLVLQWKNSSVLLHAIVLHDGIDDLEKNIMTLPMLSEYSDREEIKKVSIEAISLIKNLKTCEKISLENVL